MNTLKRIFALMLCLALMVTCFAGCHKKGEIAVKIGDIEFTSGYYACALVSADSEARAMVDEELSSSSSTSKDTVKYWKYKVEDTDYVTWVKNRAIESLKDVAALKTLCNNAGVKLSDESISTAKTYAEYLWDTYGYSSLMEPNGVSKETFIAYMQDGYLADEYFEHLYGKGGEKEIAADKVSKELTDNYVLVNKIEVSFGSLKDTEKTEKKNQLTGYEAALKDGSKTFEQVYLEYNNIKAEDHKHEEAKEGESKPKDSHASVLGAEETSYASDHFKTAKDMAVGEVKLITLDNNAGLVLLVKQDISADPYYLEEFDMMLRQDIIGEDFSKEITKYGGELAFVEITSSTKQFKVKKIKSAN